MLKRHAKLTMALEIGSAVDYSTARRHRAALH
jgi:hypothetical protein